MAEIEKFVKYATVAESMAEAWTFVMDHVDEFDLPNVEIISRRVTVQQTYDMIPSGVTMQYAVSVWGSA